jgi:hypothetical protein
VRRPRLVRTMWTFLQLPRTALLRTESGQVRDARYVDSKTSTKQRDQPADDAAQTPALPHELLVLVLSALDDVTLACAAPLVSKAFRAACSDPNLYYHPLPSPCKRGQPAPRVDPTALAALGLDAFPATTGTPSASGDSSRISVGSRRGAVCGGNPMSGTCVTGQAGQLARSLPPQWQLHAQAGAVALALYSSNLLRNPRFERRANSDVLAAMASWVPSAIPALPAFTGTATAWPVVGAVEGAAYCPTQRSAEQRRLAWVGWAAAARKPGGGGVPCLGALL